MDTRRVILNNTIKEAVSNFSDRLELERDGRGLSQKEMADILGISISSYRRIVSGESDKVPMEMIINAHRLTGMWLYQMLGESTETTVALDRYMLLNEEDQEMVRSLVNHLWRKEHGKKD